MAAVMDEWIGAGNLNAPALCRLMAWLSPAYPIGAFFYSSRGNASALAGCDDRRGRRILRCGLSRACPSRGPVVRSTIDASMHHETQYTRLFEIVNSVVMPAKAGIPQTQIRSVTSATTDHPLARMMVVEMGRER